jgi:ribosomal protein S18 acetylase RimI-like enzyme
MKIRKYELDDLPSILKIYALCKLDEFRYENGGFELLPLDQDEKRFDQLTSSDIHVCTNDKNAPIAYAAVQGSELGSLFVQPGYRGQGIGKLMLEYLLGQHAGYMELYVVKSNIPAIRLYENYGFSVVDEFTTSYNGTPLVGIKMVRAESL